jgi:hypothetical protein
VNPGATVTLTSDISYSTQPLPTGNVTLTVGTTVLQTVTLPGTSVDGNFEQIAFSASTTGIAPGTYGLTANYAGDIYNAPSTSGVVDITIKSPNTAVVSATPSPVPANTAFTLSSTVAGKVGTPTGTVFFYAGTKEVASSILNSSGVASIVVPSGTLAAATYPITAVYAGDNNNVGVTSPAVSLTIE